MLKPEYSRRTTSIPWLLMPRLLASPGHQQPWYWLQDKRILVFHEKGFRVIAPSHCYEISKDTIMFSQKNSVRQGLIGFHFSSQDLSRKAFIFPFAALWVCHPSGHYRDYCPHALSLSKVSATHLQIRHPSMNLLGARSLNDLHRFDYKTGTRIVVPSVATRCHVLLNKVAMCYSVTH